MLNRPIRILLLTLFVALLTSCGLFDRGDQDVETPAIAVPTLVVGDAATAPVAIEPTAIAPIDDAAETPVSSEATAQPPVAEATATPTIPYLIAAQDMNVRGGPGVAYGVVGFMSTGVSAEIIGRAADAGWWKIGCPPGATGAQCWISDGDAYTQAHNADGVPFAAVPPLPPTATPAIPTATPLPEVVATATEVPGIDGVLDVGFVAFVAGGNLWTTQISRPSGLITMDPPTQITFSGNLSGEPTISPDGTMVAVKQQISLLAPASLLVVDLATGTETMIADGTLLPLPPLADGFDLSTSYRVPYRFGWTADSLGVIFNTMTQFDGPGLLVNDDLWLWEVGGTAVERFAPGEGGGDFAINASNELLLTRPEAVDHVHLSGSGRVRLLDFDFVYTYSEYSYYPKPFWSDDGTTGYVAIPSQESIAPDATATLWQFTPDTPALAIDTEAGTFLFRDPIAQGDNEIILPACTTATDQYHGRNESGTHALFTRIDGDARTVILVNMADESCLTFPADALRGFRGADWVMADTYLIYAEQASGGQFQAGVTDSPAFPLLTITGADVSYDLWLN